MWRIFRLGLKNNSCNGSQCPFRIIGTSCATDNDEDGDCFGNLEDNPNYESEHYAKLKNGLASKAAEKYLNEFKSNAPEWSKNVDVDLGKNIDKSLKEIKWELYSQPNVQETTKKITPIKNSTSLSSNSEIQWKQKQNNNENELEEDREGYDLSLPSEKYGKRLSYQQYGRKILNLCKQRKLKEAIDVLEVEMAAQHVIPTDYCYHILINACGKAGYTEKAFNLFYKMKARGITPGKWAYTGLFNACANGPPEMAEYSHRQAINLRKQIKDKAIPLSPISYHAMIKAFGRLGDISTAFEIVDDMLLDKHTVTSETMNFMLQSCISNKEAGFRHAIKVWRRMRMLRLKPNIYSYNLLMRCIKECKGGDSKLLHEVLETYPTKKAQQLETERKQKLDKEVSQILSGDVEPSKLSSEDLQAIYEEEQYYQIAANNERVEVNLQDNMELEILSKEAAPPPPVEKPFLPDVLANYFIKGQVVNLISLDKAEERLALLGGPAGILTNMKKDGVKPTPATFTFLLESLPNSKTVEESLLLSMESCGVTPDVTFCNVFIKRRTMAGRIKDSRDVMNLMQLHNIEPDIVTYGCIALGCRRPREGYQLLKDLQSIGARPNIEIMGSLITNALMTREFCYSLDLLKRLHDFNLYPNKRIINRLEQSRLRIRKHLLELENGTKTASEMTANQKRKLDESRVFLYEYKKWLQNSKLRKSDHPWAQYGHDGSSPKTSVIAKSEN